MSTTEILRGLLRVLIVHEKDLLKMFAENQFMIAFIAGQMVPEQDLLKDVTPPEEMEEQELEEEEGGGLGRVDPDNDDGDDYDDDGQGGLESMTRWTVRALHSLTLLHPL